MPPREYWVAFCKKIGDNLFVYELVDIGTHLECEEEKTEDIIELKESVTHYGKDC